MASIIRIITTARGIPSPHDGEYVVSCDFDAHRGRGLVTTSPEQAMAKRFETFEDAARYWKKISPQYPQRDDGKPNRPLTAFTCEILPVETKAECFGMYHPELVGPCEGELMVSTGWNSDPVYRCERHAGMTRLMNPTLPEFVKYVP
jgi:hypothetical protein